jgi:hypothetical protein
MSETAERERYASLMNRPNAVFVFGSNREGKHGGGAARAAHQLYGAKWALGEGPQGRSYAIPTMDRIGYPLEVSEIRLHINRFLAYAERHSEAVFVLTRVGCGIAGYSDKEIAPLFRKAPANVILPLEWEGLT